MRPNVLLVILDAARRDALEPYGAPRGSTPAIAQLAEAGAALPDVYATGCWTVPSHASIFTGLLPRAAGLGQAKTPNECHSPYLPPRPYGDLSLLERLRAADDARRYYKLESIWRSCVGGFDMPDDALDRMRRLYRASIRYMDDWLARLLERLGAAGALDDTLVVVTSDHGENLGEGGLVAHGLSL